MLDNLGLTYGLDSSRLGKGGGMGGGMGGGGDGYGWNDMESMSWGDLDGGNNNSNNRGADLRRGRGGKNRRSPQKPGGAMPARLQQGQSPRQRRGVR